MKLLSFKGPKLTTPVLTLAALLTALQLIFDKFSLGNQQVVLIGLGFMITAISGYFLGPWLTGITMVITDLLSNTVFNTGSMFFPGYTFSALISGLIAGMFLYQAKPTLLRILTYEFVQILVTNVFFNTLWLVMMGFAKDGALVLLKIRLVKEIITWPLETIVVLILLRALQRVKLKIN